MKSYKTALVLVAILLALGGLATWDEMKTKSEEEEKQTKNRLTAAKVEDVVGLRYVSRGGPGEADEGEPAAAQEPVDATLAKADGVWRVTKPVEGLADGGSVESLLKTVLEYSYAKTVTSDRAQWKEYGLETPQRSIYLTFSEASGQAPLELHVGDKAPVGYNVYLRTNKSDEVFLGSQYLLTSSSKSLLELRDKSLVKIDEPQVRAFVYERRGEPTIELQKADGRWTIVRPEPLEADGAEARDFLANFNSVRVAGFIDAPSADLQALFADPAYRLTWSAEDGRATTLAFVEHEGKILAAFDPAQRVFQMPDDFRAQIRRGLIDFRNRRVLGFDAAEAQRVEVDGAAFENVNGDWFPVVAEGAEKPAEATHIRALLVDLEFAKTDRFLAPTDPEVASDLAKAPEHRIQVAFKKPETPPMTLDLHAVTGAPERFYVKRSGSETVYRIARSAFNSMKPGTGRIEAPSPEGEEEDGPAGAPFPDEPMLDMDEIPSEDEGAAVSG